MLEEAGYEPLNLRDAGVVELLEEERLEQYETFEENALAKGRYLPQAKTTSAIERHKLVLPPICVPLG